MRISDWSSDVCSSDLVRVASDDERAGPGYAILIYSAIGLVIAALGPAYAQYVTLRSANARIAPMLPQTVGEWTALSDGDNPLRWHQIGRASCRERVGRSG